MCGVRVNVWVETVFFTKTVCVFSVYLCVYVVRIRVINGFGVCRSRDTIFSPSASIPGSNNLLKN